MLKYTLSRSSLVKIYFSFIRPVLEYADVVWDGCSEQDSKSLEDIQIEAARIITGMRYNSSRSKLYDELGWEPLEIRRRNHRLTLFYKIVNGYTPEYLADMLESCKSSHHNYNLRTTRT